jgi:hypothetical protein
LKTLVFLEGVMGNRFSFSGSSRLALALVAAAIVAIAAFAAGVEVGEWRTRQLVDLPHNKP